MVPTAVQGLTGGYAGRRSRRICWRCRGSCTTPPPSAPSTSFTRYAPHFSSISRSLSTHMVRFGGSASMPPNEQVSSSLPPQLCNGASAAERDRWRLKSVNAHAYTAIQEAMPTGTLSPAMTPKTRPVSKTHMHMSMVCLSPRAVHVSGVGGGGWKGESKASDSVRFGKDQYLMHIHMYGLPIVGQDPARQR